MATRNCQAIGVAMDDNFAARVVDRPGTSACTTTGRGVFLSAALLCVTVRLAAAEVSVQLLVWPRHNGSQRYVYWYDTRITMISVHVFTK